MKGKVIELSQKFWKPLEKADSKEMREVSDPACRTAGRPPVTL